ncbi:MAG: glycosyltransferase family 2 protein [Caulobacteraceae bacterium]|nr:glycosyltransferase family 2 protein [Caulobacteraceae bacterium]
MNFVRRIPLVRIAVHAVAVELAKTRLGARFIRAVIEPQYPTSAAYRAWIAAHDTLSDADRTAIAAHIAAMARRPLISVVMPAYNTPEPLLRAAIESVRAQLYPHWELCVADDASPDEDVWCVLGEYAASDPRIKATRRPANGHISLATNSALELASGEFVALMDHDDLLAEQALYEVAALLDRHPDADIVYSDEDKVDDAGRRFEPHFKTDWNAELMLGQNAVSHLGVYRRSLVTAVGGLRAGFEGSQDFDLTLRVSALTTPARIHHIPAILYHWRQTGERSFSETDIARCADAARRAVAEHLESTGQTGATVTSQSQTKAWLHVRRAVPSPAPLVSIIVPTRDRADLLAGCVEGVLNRTAYRSLELIIVDNGSVEPQTHALFERIAADPRVTILPAPGPFNFSALNNQAVAASKGEIVLLLNNDISMIDDGWLGELVAQAVRPNVGAVGAKLLYPDGRVQHAGVVMGIGGDPPVAGHLYHGAGRDEVGYFGHLTMVRNVTAVTGACLALRRAVYDEVGGLSEDLAVAFNDIDLCLKIRARGYDIVWTPFAELHHHESASRGDDMTTAAHARFRSEVMLMRERWGSVLDDDPFYGPHFSRWHGDYRLAPVSRRVRPWEAAAAA